MKNPIKRFNLWRQSEVAKRRKAKQLLPFYLKDYTPDNEAYWAIGISKDQRYAGGVRGWKNGRDK